ncbi:MAG: YbaB/EbfC family nucleoid-associated protein [Hormoscilla sp. GUM202]|nr:YbaB/EbfC family nucleoid-associated protein [Hormoscilla sp. GUM202]
MIDRLFVCLGNIFLGLGVMKMLTEALKKAQQVQEDGQQLQSELEELEVEGSAGGGLVKVVFNGEQRPQRVTIAPELMSQEADVVSDLVTAAMVDAYNKSTETRQECMQNITEGWNK